MTRDAGARPTVAHFRRTWFRPTETFLHNTVTGLRATRPLLVGYERTHAEAFPVECPVVTLFPSGSLAARWNHLRARLWDGPYRARYHVPRGLRALEQHRVRVLHAHFGYTGCHVLPVKRHTGLPLVVTFYGEDVSCLGRDPRWRERYDELFAEGDRFLVEGPFMRQRLAELGCPREKIGLQPIGIPPLRYPFRLRRPRPRSQPTRLFFCARFIEKKGLAFALEAVARARQEHPALELRIGGDGPERPRLERQIDQLGLRDCVALLGFLPHARMLEEMAAADLFLQPSVTAKSGDAEGGAPTTLLEAQACGVPVLATLHADIPYVVDEGESSLLSPERDVDGLTANLVRLLKEPERWAVMGAAGRERIERFHDVERVLRPLEDLHLELAGTPTCCPG